MLPQTGSEGAGAVVDFVLRALEARVDMVQIRERDLSARDALEIADVCARAARRYGAQVLVNDRADVAAAAGAGVHLTTRSMDAGIVRSSFGPDMLIGASTHSIEEAITAERGGADFVVFGPVFETESKRQYGPPVGLDALAAVARLLKIPVLALGGVNLRNFRGALDAGASGIAGISLFTRADDLGSIVRAIKGS
jgi:thiamine-phosphate pyrophosphorylase